jgi:hypothetical protein
LRLLAQGDPAVVHLNFAFGLIPFALALLFALLTTHVKSNRLYEAYIIICLVSGLWGLQSLAQYLLRRGEPKKLADKIRARMQAPGGIQQNTTNP